MSLSVMRPYESMRFFFWEIKSVCSPYSARCSLLNSDGNEGKRKKELKQRMRDDSLRGEDEHIRQELPGNNWVTLWWSATITSKCSRGGNPINPIWSISRRRLCFGTHVCVSSCDSGDAIWQAILHGWRQSSVQESKVRCRLVNKALIGRIDFTWHGFHKDVALSRTPSPPSFLLLSSVVPRRTHSTSPRCK